MDKGSTTIEEEILKEMEDVIRKAAEAPLPAPEKPPEAPPAAPPGAPSEAPPAPPAAPEAPPKDLVEAVKKALSEKPGEKEPKAPPEKPPKAPQKRPKKPREGVTVPKLKPEEEAAMRKEIDEALREEEESIKRKEAEEAEKEKAVKKAAPPGEEFYEVEKVPEILPPEVQDFKNSLIDHEKLLFEQLEMVLDHFEKEKPLLDKEDPFYEEKKKILEERIAIIREEIKEKEKEAAEALAAVTKEIIEKAREAEIEKHAKEIFEKRTRGEEPYTKEVIEKILKDAGVKPEEAGAFMKEWDKKEAEKLIKIEKEEEKKKEELLEKLKEAREKLVQAEKNMKEFEGLAGLFKGFIKREEKSNVAEEFEKAEREYKEARAEFVAGDFERIVKERSDLADQKAEKLYKERGRLYKFWKNLGELNLAAAYKKIAGREIKSKILRFGARIISVRTGISAGLLGLGIAAGAGTAAGIGIFLARRGFAGLGAGVGTYDLLKLGTEKWAATKGWRAEVVPEELEKMKIEEIEERMAHFEVNAPFVGKKVSENETYLKLSERYKELKNQEAEKNADKLQAFLNKSMEEADGKLEAVKAKSKRNERIIKGLAVGAGIFVGSGVISKLISGKWGWEQFGRVGAVESQTAVKAPTEVNLEAAENQLRLPDEFVSKIAGPDRLLGNQEMASLTGLEKYLTDAGLDPQSEEVVRGLGIENIGDISKAEINLEHLLGVTKDPEIIKSVVERGLDADDAENLKALLDQVEKMPVTLSPELKQDFFKAVILNNFENQQDFLNILKNVDVEHLSVAGILKEAKLDIEKIREIVGAHTVTIDKKGETLYQALREYYTAPVEKGGLGLTGQEARAKIFEQFHNGALLKEGKLQDLVEVGDQIKVDNKGNVLLYIAEDGEMARKRDILSLIGDNDIKSGKQVFDIKEGIKVRAAANPLDGHTIIRITDAEGVTHRIADWSVGKTAYVDGKKVILEDWLREKDLLSEKRTWVPEKLEDLKEFPKEAAEFEEFKETQRYFMEQQHNYLHDLGKMRETAIAAGNEELAHNLTHKIETVEDAIGQMKKVTLQDQVVAAHGKLDKIIEQFGVAKVEDFPEMDKAELAHNVDKLKDVLDSTSPEDLSSSAEVVREHVALAHDYGKELNTGGIPKEEILSKAKIEELPEIVGAAKVGEAVYLPEGKINFGYDEFGNVTGYKSDIKFLPEPEKFLKEDYYKTLTEKCEETGRDIGFAKTDVGTMATDIDGMDRIHHHLLEKGMTSEDKFIEKAITKKVEDAEKMYGDVFK